jgi:tripartite-type tricarboxylate transporter receptor subunit TctC
LAEGFPSRPINLIVMAPAGGSTDVGARVVAALAEKIAGQPMVVVNKGGAGGQVGWTELARAKPDGYTIGFVVLPGMNTQVLDPARKAIFTEGSFIPVANQVSDPGTLWVKADSPFKSFADVIAAAKKAPGTVRAATTGILSDDHLAILMTEEATGAHFRIVHLDGNANQLKETLAGNVDVAFDNVGGAIKPVKAGQGRALLVTDALRSKFLPHVPTSVELGFPTIISNSTRGITAPKGTPPEVLAKLGEILRKAMAEPEHNEKLEAQGLTVKVMIGDDYAKFYNEAHEKAKKYVAWSRERSQK